MFATLPLQHLPIGAKLGASIFDERQTKLLGAGIEITEHLLETLSRRNVASVIVGEQDLARVMAYKPQGKARTTAADRQGIQVNPESDVCRQLDRIGIGIGVARIESSANPFSERIRPARHESYDRDCLNFLADQRERHVAQVNEVAEACASGDSSGVGMLHDVLQSSLEESTEDFDAFACLGGNPFAKPYPTRHSVHTSMVATSIGTALGLDEKQLLDLGIGCLIHDIGMLTIDRMTLQARKVLDAVEFSEIIKHPFKTFDLIEAHIDQIPAAARMVAYQMHERADGSGYPRGRTLEQTHPLARIAAVADAYTALVSSRPHRHGMLPYYAMEKLIKDVAAGLYDPVAVRGLLQALGLFPVGSYVELKSGLVGRVIRASTGDYSRPLIEVWKAGSVRGAPAIVDLARESNLGIVRPLTTLER